MPCCPESAYETLWVLGIGILIVYIFDLIMKTLRAYFLDVAGQTGRYHPVFDDIRKDHGIKSCRPAPFGGQPGQ